MTETLAYGVVFLAGAVVGSFLNICIQRLPRRESLISPGSRCPVCLTPIPPRDKIPLLSYLFLGGRCRFCGSDIPVRYFGVELMNGVGYSLVFGRYGAEWTAVVYAALFSSLLVVTWIDLAHRIIPDAITLPGIPVGLLCAMVVLPVGLLDAVAGILVGGGLLWALAVASPYVFGKEGMGGGDIKLLAMVGAFLGWKLTLLALMLAAVTGSVVGGGLMITGKLREPHYIPFGPFLALGAAVSLLSGPELLEGYLRVVTGP